MEVEIVLHESLSLLRIQRRNAWREPDGSIQEKAGNKATVRKILLFSAEKTGRE